MHKTLFNFGIKKNIVLYFIIFFITLIFINSFLDRTKPNSDPRLTYKYTYYAIPISISNTLTEIDFEQSLNIQQPHPSTISP